MCGATSAARDAGGSSPVAAAAGICAGASVALSRQNCATNVTPMTQRGEGAPHNAPKSRGGASSSLQTSVRERPSSRESLTLRRTLLKRVASAQTRRQGHPRRVASRTRRRSAQERTSGGFTTEVRTRWTVGACLLPAQGLKHAREPVPPGRVRAVCALRSDGCAASPSPGTGCVAKPCAAPHGCAAPYSRHLLRCARGEAASRRCWHAQVPIPARRSIWHSSGCPAPA